VLVVVLECFVVEPPTEATIRNGVLVQLY
jgi:hypothetical protein